MVQLPSHTENTFCFVSSDLAPPQFLGIVQIRKQIYPKTNKKIFHFSPDLTNKLFPKHFTLNLVIYFFKWLILNLYSTAPVFVCLLLFSQTRFLDSQKIWFQHNNDRTLTKLFEVVVFPLRKDVLQILRHKGCCCWWSQPPLCWVDEGWMEAGWRRRAERTLTTQIVTTLTLCQPSQLLHNVLFNHRGTPPPHPAGRSGEVQMFHCPHLDHVLLSCLINTFGFDMNLCQFVLSLFRWAPAVTQNRLISYF